MFSLNSQAWVLPAGEFSFEKVAEQVYVMHGPLGEPSVENHGFMNNPAIIESANGLIVVDPGSTYGVGKQVLLEIEKISKNPILAVFNSHIHGDHWLANQAIKEKYPNVKIYGSAAMIEQATGGEGEKWLGIMESLTEGMSKSTQVVEPDSAVAHAQTIEVDGEKFKIHAITPAHTDTDIMIEHIGSKTVFLGDNGFSHRMGRFDDSSSIHGNILALEHATQLGASLYVPGHGKTGPQAATVQPFLDYLQKLKAAVQVGYDDDKADYEIKEASGDDFAKFKQWAGFEGNFGKHISKMYLEIEEM